MKDILEGIGMVLLLILAIIVTGIFWLLVTPLIMIAAIVDICQAIINRISGDKVIYIKKIDISKTDKEENPNE